VTNVSDKLINVIVETMDGEEVTVKVNVENKVEHLMRMAAKELDIQGDVRLYDLMLENQRLDPDAKLESTPVRDGTRVRLERRPKVG
jgi:hypothetical protein